jgi:hypothetical protein
MKMHGLGLILDLKEFVAKDENDMEYKMSFVWCDFE